MDIEKLVTELFEVFDVNNDGVISRGEFVALIESLMEKEEIGGDGMASNNNPNDGKKKKGGKKKKTPGPVKYGLNIWCVEGS